MDEINILYTVRPGFQFIDREEVRLRGIKRITLTGDVGCTGFYEDSKKILDRILKQQTDLFFILGDLVFTGAEDEFREVIDFCNSRVQVPIFALAGNHDLPNYEKFLGLSSYAIVLDGLVCIFLDNAAGHFSEQGIAFLKKELNKYRDRNFMLFMHVPPPTDIDRSHLLEAEWGKVKKVMDQYQDRIKYIFCAHIHGFHDYYLDGFPITISAGGGAAMINDLKKPEQKFHHAIVINIHDDDNVSTEIIPL